MKVFSLLPTVISTLLAVSNAYANERCQSEFSSLNESSIAAIAANICTLDAIKENERLPLTYKTSSTYTHNFNISKYGNIISASGTCSNVVDMYSKQIYEGRKFRIDFDTDRFNKESNPVFVGKLGQGYLGTIDLKVVFKTYSSFDPECTNQYSRHKVLAAIVAGQGVLDIFKRERSNLVAHNISQTWGNSWSQSELNLDFKVTQFTGRNLRLLTNLDRYANLLVKSGNYLFKEEGDPSFSISNRRANNIFLKNRTEYQGCSVFIQGSELEIPYFMSSLECSELGYKTNSFLTHKRSK